MVRYTLVLFILFISCMPNKNSQNQEKTTSNDTVVHKVKTISNNIEEPKTTTDPTNTGTEEQSDLEYSIEDKGWLYNPFDFPLEAETIKFLLGEEVEIKEEYVDDENGAYTYTTVTYQDTKISFYGFGGYETQITTPKLSVLDGIKIGMKKTDFIEAMKFDPKKPQRRTFLVSRILMEAWSSASNQTRYIVFLGITKRAIRTRLGRKNPKGSQKK